MTVQTCPGPRNPCTRLPGESRIALIAGGTSTCDTSTLKFVSFRLCASHTAIAFGGAVVSKPDGEKDHLAIRIGRGQIHRIQWGIDDADVGPLAFELKQIPPRPRHAQHVAE